MRFLIDFFPIALFAGAYFLLGDVANALGIQPLASYYFETKDNKLYAATAVLMAATALQTLVIYAMDRKLETLQKVTLLIVLIFGTLTLALHDERFIKWKPTVLYSTLSVAMAAALWIWKRNVLQMLLGSKLSLPEEVWKGVTAMWIAFFLFLALANAYVVMKFSTEFWVSFKLWGTAFWLPFFVVQGLYLSKHLKDDDDPEAKS